MSFIDVCRDKKVLHITDSDLDGVSCRVVSEYYLKNICDLTIIQSSIENLNDFSELNYEDYDVVFFTDLAPNKNLYDKIKEKTNVYIFDHHETTKDILGDIDNYIYNIKQCGTKIFYHELVTNRSLYNKTVFDYVTYVNAYDLWYDEIVEFEMARKLNLLLWNFVRKGRRTVRKKDPSTKMYDEFVQLQLSKFDLSELKNQSQVGFFLWPREENTIKYEMLLEEQELEKTDATFQERVDGKGFKYGYYEAKRKISYTAHCLLKRHKHLSYMLVYDSYLPKELKFSLRSRKEDFSVKNLVEPWGGGGHFSACGVSFKGKENGKEIFEKLISGEMHLQ